MNPPVRSDIIRQSVRVSGFQLRQLAILQNILNDGILRRQLLQHIRRCGVSCLGLLASRKLHFFKENHAQLFRRINIKRLSCLLIDLFFQLCDAYLKLFPILMERLALHLNSFLLHRIQREHQGHLNLTEDIFHPLFPQGLLQRFLGFQSHIGHVTGQTSAILRLFLQCFFICQFPQKLHPARTDFSQIFFRNILIIIRRFQRIQKVGCNLPVKGLTPVIQIYIF